MRVLIIKTSSLGDVINTLPALTDAIQHNPQTNFDWVIEPAFAEIPAWHTQVKKIIPAALRYWRKHPWQTWQNRDWQNFYADLRQENYDYVIDAQGLIKSALLTYFSRGIRCGYDRHSAWEPLACLAYDRKYAVAPQQHAITRIRQLFAQVLGYSLPETTHDCGLSKTQWARPKNLPEKYCVFLHGTARDEKCWPEMQWQQLITYMRELPQKILLPWGNDKEKARAERLAENQPHVQVLSRCNLTELASILAYSTANVAVDTGLGHLAAALNSPTLSLYGPTRPEFNGTVGENQQHIKVPSLAQLDAMQVWEKFNAILSFEK